MKNNIIAFKKDLHSFGSDGSFFSHNLTEFHAVGRITRIDGIKVFIINSFFVNTNRGLTGNVLIDTVI